MLILDLLIARVVEVKAESNLIVASHHCLCGREGEGEGVRCERARVRGGSEMFQQGKQAFVLSNNTACMPPSSPLMNSISDDFAPHEPNRQLKQPHKISKNLDKVWHAPGRIPNKFPEMHVTLKYFPIRGRAEPVRLICADANIDLIDESVGGRWAEEKTKTDVYLFGQCPAAVIDGVSIAQGYVSFSISGDLNANL